MENVTRSPVIPPTLLAKVHAVAEQNHRSVDDILCDAVERGLRELNAQKSKRLEQVKEVARRMLESREGHPSINDIALKELMTHGRG